MHQPNPSLGRRNFLKATTAVGVAALVGRVAAAPAPADPFAGLV